jgi:hypothetical protein
VNGEAVQGKKLIGEELEGKRKKKKKRLKREKKRERVK